MKNFLSILKRKAVVTTALTATLVAGSLSTTVQAEVDEDTSLWSWEQADKIERTKDNTAPQISEEEIQDIAPDLYVWDTWPLRNRDGSVARVNGYKVIFSLTAEKEGVTPSERHGIAKIRYFYSKDGKSWELGGLAYDPEEALGSRQWAGSAMMDDGKVNLFYTATGRKSNETKTYEQRLARVTADIEADKDGVELTSNGDHEILLEADGEHYQTLEQSEGKGIIYSFRDPWFFQDPKSGEEYLVFEGNSAGTASEQTCQPENIGSKSFQKKHDAPEDAALYNGAVGIAKKGEDLSDWNLQEPILEADCVNQQLERPHFMVKGNQYYLFTITHKFTFAPQVSGPDGLYGFTSKSLHGDYEPLNDSGLVIANPENDPLQAYSWVVLPHGEVSSFVNKYKTEDGEQKFGGTLAPTLKLSVHKDETKIVNESKFPKIK
ncbi:MULTISPECIES: glycoside hydrolase family 68 protein [Pontibacillus]|uniref:Glycoside hydrolase family 68 protein n=1 Tax=Pontibacillus chungwhensis TaxID=265426 RepID=A0ABY8UZD1_9BACI|nr:MULTISPECIES: glycoside hydrolase family 68 protein [Pontibacillus]MCD5324878.1 glycoside hydrolase family 68 protein [Pontibacillus sp. HN14]WIF98839.1 glycoside hydrolase family 68 protein [Pontibacillus chungwhensis]